MNDTITTIAAEDLDERRATGSFRPGAYRVKEHGTVLFCWSPDGEGCYWYTDADDMRAAIEFEVDAQKYETKEN